MCKSFRAAMAIFALLSGMIVACGGGGGGGQPAAAPTPTPATFDLIFPGETSLTDASQISVVGVTESNQVSSVSFRNGANESIAVLDSNGRWRASDVPLQAGTNSLIVEMTMTDGTVTERTIANVQSSPILSSPAGVSFDANSGRIFIVDAKQLLAFDSTNDVLEIISSPKMGTGPDFGFARHLALAGDGAVLVSDFSRVLRVDPITGDRTEHVVFPAGSFPGTTIARDKQLNRLFTVGLFKDLHVADLNETPPIVAMPVGTPPSFGIVAGAPSDSTYVAGTNIVYAVDISSLDVFAIDAATGESESLLVGGGGLFTTTVGIDYDEVDDRVLVLGLSGAVFSVDPNTRASSVLVPSPSSMDPPKALNGLTLSNGQLWTVSPAASELTSIDLSNGNQTVEVSTGVGDGEAPGFMLAGRYDPIGDRFVAISDLRVVAIDPMTGSRELLVDLVDPIALLTPSIAPPSFFLSTGMALSQDGTRAWLTDLTGILAEVNLVSGEIQEVSSATAGSGPLPGQIAGIAVSPDETVAYVADPFVRRILRVELATGRRELLPEFAADLDLTEIRALVLDADANRLLLHIAPSTPAAVVGPRIYALDLSSFELTQVADLSAVLSPFDGFPIFGLPTLQMSLSADGSNLFFPVAGNPDVPYVRIDLTLGEAFPLGDESSGPPFFIPNAIDVAPDGRLFAFDATSALFVIDAESGERAIASK